MTPWSRRQILGAAGSATLVAAGLQACAAPTKSQPPAFRLAPDLNTLAPPAVREFRGAWVATVANMQQNLAFAFVYNALGIPLAAGLLYPLTGWLLSPMIAALAMSLSSVSVIGNALRLRAVRIRPGVPQGQH